MIRLEVWLNDKNVQVYYLTPQRKPIVLDIDWFSLHSHLISFPPDRISYEMIEKCLESLYIKVIDSETEEELYSSDTSEILPGMNRNDTFKFEYDEDEGDEGIELDLKHQFKLGRYHHCPWVHMLFHGCWSIFPYPVSGQPKGYYLTGIELVSFLYDKYRTKELTLKSREIPSFVNSLLQQNDHAFWITDSLWPDEIHIVQLKGNTAYNCGLMGRTSLQKWFKRDAINQQHYHQLTTLIDHYNVFLENTSDGLYLNWKNAPKSMITDWHMREAIALDKKDICMQLLIPSEYNIANRIYVFNYNGIDWDLVTSLISKCQ